MNNFTIQLASDHVCILSFATTCYSIIKQSNPNVSTHPSRKRMNLVIHDFEPGWDTYIERIGYLQESDISFDEVNVDDYDAILLLGGRAPEFLRHDARVIEIVRAFAAQDKWLFAICHGIQILVAAGLVANKTLTCYENCRFEVESVKGTWDNRQAVRDGKMVTGQTWQSHPEFYREVFACLAETAPAGVQES